MVWWRGGAGAGGGGGGGVGVVECSVLVHLPRGLGSRRRAAAVEHHGLLHPDGPAVGGVDDPRGARRLPVPGRRGPARPAAPRLPLLPRAEVEPRLPLLAAAAQHLVVNLCSRCVYTGDAALARRTTNAMHVHACAGT
ncbi:Os01g0862850 [Oryza sativa Japonica Group]|uniref:Os01g0862850 protein n=1 Tax=Oryza sativa subsp. japonica TaxID=39947 RepID=A0A0N7KE40_ORYSJ|nr:hypothetical protein EE612_006981 [Oryza sativa]BAS75353.1 Os01g0862850 [Oryza sativa Japonica Group]